MCVKEIHSIIPGHSPRPYHSLILMLRISGHRLLSKRIPDGKNTMFLCPPLKCCCVQLTMRVGTKRKRPNSFPRGCEDRKTTKGHEAATVQFIKY